MKKILLLLCFAGLWANAEYAKACVKGNASACSNLGKTYENAPVGLRDNAAVQDAYKMACELKDANSCYKVGHMYHEYLYYEGVKADRAAAAKFYKKACDLGDGNGCSGLGMMYIEGIYVEQNYSKAVELYEKACDLGVAASCVKTAKLYTDGEIVEQNYSKVVEFYEKACGKDDVHSCYHLGLLYTRHRIVERDYYKALRVFKKSCAADNYMFSCGFVRDYQEKVKYLEAAEACTSGKLLSCNELGYMYKEGRGVEKNIVKAIELFTKTCNDEADFGCAALDDIYDNLSENKNEARHYYSKACDFITEKTYACAQYRRLIKEQCLEIFKYFVIGAGIIAMFAAVYLFRRKSLEQPR